MRFGRRSTADDEGGMPIRLPFMKRNRQPAQESKENVPPEDGDMHDSAFSSPKASRRKTVFDLFKHKDGGHKDDEETDNILTRMTAQRNKSVSVDSIYTYTSCHSLIHFLRKSIDAAKARIP